MTSSQDGRWSTPVPPQTHSRTYRNGDQTRLEKVPLTVSFALSATAGGLCDRTGFRLRHRCGCRFHRPIRVYLRGETEQETPAPQIPGFGSHCWTDGERAAEQGEPPIFQERCPFLGEPLKLLDTFPDVVEGAAGALEPHRVVYYAQKLAGEFHRYYSRHRCVTDDAKVTNGRLLLVSAVQLVIRRALDLVGVSAPERM